MSDGLTEAAPERADARDNKAATALGHAIWIAAMGKEGPADSLARKAAWMEVKRDHVKLAKLVLRRLEKRGFTLTETAGSADSDDEA